MSVEPGFPEGESSRLTGPGAPNSDPLLPAASAAIWTGSSSGVFEEGGVVSGKESWGFLVSPSFFLFSFLFLFGPAGFRLRELAHGFFDEEEEI
jgi:hypothetical protein